ncbi:hypothetical protein AVEN_206398-1 [Araneus ventricosus]|uniref:Uncharacterized protein n=1 Tax=Araneus ventricosus TaxID=182803 RepID=A0A4Y2EN25_ARAVE|nr:hypothetical protein AVEN_206398-1 [Araneus ventricosus]
MDSDVFDFEPRNVADSNESNHVFFLNQADQVCNLESSITETVCISRNTFSNKKDWKRNVAKINRRKGNACMGFRRADSKTTKAILQDVHREEKKIGRACNCRKVGIKKVGM